MNPISKRHERLIRRIERALDKRDEYPAIFIGIAEKLPSNFPKDYAAIVLENMPRDDELFYEWKSTFSIEDAIKALAKINPDGYLEYLISAASIILHSKSFDQVETIKECIREVVPNEKKQEWLIKQLNVMRDEYSHHDVAEHVDLIKKVLSEIDFNAADDWSAHFQK